MYDRFWIYPKILLIFHKKLILTKICILLIYTYTYFAFFILYFVFYFEGHFVLLPYAYYYNEYLYMLKAYELEI